MHTKILLIDMFSDEPIASLPQHSWSWIARRTCVRQVARKYVFFLLGLSTAFLCEGAACLHGPPRPLNKMAKRHAHSP